MFLSPTPFKISFNDLMPCSGAPCSISVSALPQPSHALTTLAYKGYRQRQFFRLFGVLPLQLNPSTGSIHQQL